MPADSQMSDTADAPFKSSTWSANVPGVKEAARRNWAGEDGRMHTLPPVAHSLFPIFKGEGKEGGTNRRGSGSGRRGRGGRGPGTKGRNLATSLYEPNQGGELRVPSEVEGMGKEGSELGYRMVGIVGPSRVEDDGSSSGPSDGTTATNIPMDVDVETNPEAIEMGFSHWFTDPETTGTSSTAVLPQSEEARILKVPCKLLTLRDEYISQLYAAKFNALEIHGRDFRLGACLLALLELLNERGLYREIQDALVERLIDTEKRMEDMGWDDEDMEIEETHEGVNEMMKTMLGYQFSYIKTGKTMTKLERLQALELGRDGVHGDAIDIASDIGFRDLGPGQETVMVIPVTRGRMSSWDIQDLGRVLAENPIAVWGDLLRLERIGDT